MLNDFRTKLLNISYANNAGEHIPQAFTAFPLNAAMTDFQKLLFPENASRFYRIFLTHNYLSLIEAAGLQAQLIKNDTRISYKLDNNYFKFSRITNPVLSNSNFAIEVTGTYKNDVANENFYDSILVSQKTNTLNIDIYSNTNDTFYAQSIPLSFPHPTNVGSNTGASDLIRISDSGLSFQIIASQSFTGTSNKTWEFIAEAPYVFDFSALYTRLNSRSPIVDEMLRQTSTEKNESMINMWKNHFNPVYQVAALLVAYVDRIKI